MHGRELPTHSPSANRASTGASTLKALLLDAVGTILEPAESVAATYARIGRRHGSLLPAEVVRERFHQAFAFEEAKDHSQNLQTDEPRERARWQAIVAHTFCDLPRTQALFEELWQYYAQPESWLPNADLAAVVQQAQARGFRVAVASNFDARLRTICQGQACLANTGLFISSELGWRKPARQFFEQIAQVWSLGPGQAIFVGDSLSNDIQGAHQVGWKSVWLDGNQPNQGTMAPGNAPAVPFARIERLADLLPFLE